MPTFLQLQVLHGKFHIHHPPAPGFDIVTAVRFARQLIFHPHPQAVDLLASLIINRGAIQSVADNIVQLTGQVVIPQHDTGLGKRLSFPDL